MTAYDYRWIVGDVLRLPDGRTGQVVELRPDEVTIRFPGGHTLPWKADELTGTGLWLSLAAKEYQ